MICTVSSAWRLPYQFSIYLAGLPNAQGTASSYQSTAHHQKSMQTLHEPLRQPKNAPRAPAQAFRLPSLSLDHLRRLPPVQMHHVQQAIHPQRHPRQTLQDACRQPQSVPDVPIALRVQVKAEIAHEKAHRRAAIPMQNMPRRAIMHQKIQSSPKPRKAHKESSSRRWT